MAKCNQLTPLPCKGLKQVIRQVFCCRQKTNVIS